MSRIPSPKRSEIWLVDFDPSVGAEICKLRHAVVISIRDVGRLPLRIVVPVTDWDLGYVALSWLIFLPASPVNGLRKDSAADTFQVRSASLDRFRRKIGVVSDDQALEIANAIANAVGAP